MSVTSCAAGSGTCYNKTLSSEVFSSDGPRAVFFSADGVTPLVENLAGPGIKINNPTLAGVDGTSTSVSGFSSFGGTSAAAPHVAALLALLLSAAPGVSADDAITLLKASVIPVNSSADAGLGIPWLEPVFAALSNCTRLGGSYFQANNLTCMACPLTQNGTVGLASCRSAPTSPPPTTAIPTTETPTTVAPTTHSPTTLPPGTPHSGVSRLERVSWLTLAVSLIFFVNVT